MNRGRHKKIQFPYKKDVLIKLFYFWDHPKVNRRICTENYRQFADQSELNWYLAFEMNNPFYHVLEIQIIHNQKIIKIYKRYQFHNKTL